MQLTASTNDQLMAMAAHSYCLGRSTYIVAACIEWLGEVWPQLVENSQNVILRDTIIALCDDRAGLPQVADEWLHAARWMWRNIEQSQSDWVSRSVAYKGIDDVRAFLGFEPA